MRRFLGLLTAGGLVWWFFVRGRGDAAEESATIGYADGSAVTLEAGSPELELLVRIASEARSR